MSLQLDMEIQVVQRTIRFLTVFVAAFIVSLDFAVASSLSSLVMRSRCEYMTDIPTRCICG